MTFSDISSNILKRVRKIIDYLVKNNYNGRQFIFKGVLILEKATLKKLIDVAAGRIPADLVLKNARIVNVMTHCLINGDVAISDGLIAGIADHYDGHQTIDLNHHFLAPGLIDAHIHIESAYVSPEEFSRLFVPHGTTTVSTDPHEIVNVAGLTGLNYMQTAAKQAAMDIRFMMPPCVPSTPFEHAGAHLTAKDIQPRLADNQVNGLAELMNYVGVVNNNDNMLDEILAAKATGHRIDGHAPELMGKALNAYAAAGAVSDHECMTIEEAQARLDVGMYLMIREGTTEHNLIDLLPIVNSANARRCLLVGDDVQTKTVLSIGHLDHSIRLAIANGLDPITAIQMATLNAAEYCGLADRGAITPGRRADLIVVDDLQHFKVEQVLIKGQIVAKNHQYLLPVKRTAIDSVANTMAVKPFSTSQFKLNLSGKMIRAIQVLPGQVATGEKHLQPTVDSDHDFKFNPYQDLVKIAVVERHHHTGNLAVALLADYGLKHGAIASSIAHDSHNVIVAGVNNEEMKAAVEALINQGGGAVAVKDGQVKAKFVLPIAGLMSDQPGEVIVKTQTHFDQVAHDILGIPANIDPLMTLSFMSLAVIPKLKLTDEGLFDVAQMKFVPLEIAN